MFTKEQMLKLVVGDCVRLKKWKNKKDGTQLVTSYENVILAGRNKEYASFRNLTVYYKDAKLEEYGVTWYLEPVNNSYKERGECYE